MTELNIRQQNKIETRRLLLQAGLELFVEQGYEKTRADEIALKAGVAVGTLYLHFGDKAGLLQEILLQSALELHERVLIVYRNPESDPNVLARAHIETIVQFLEENQKEARFLLGYALRRDSASAIVIDKIVEQVERSLEFGAKMGVYRMDINPALTARAEVNMNLGLLAWWMEDPQRATREEIIETLTKFRTSGLHIQPKT
jgi:AcrR family transcriptional regulator